MIDINIAKKITLEEMFKSTTMFYINKEYEEEISQYVDKTVKHMSNELLKINEKDELVKYIKSNKFALENITSLMDISTQRFLRMVSMIRKDKGYTFQSEWNLTSIRSNMLQNEIIMDTVCDLLLNGKNSDYFIDTIPNYYLNNMIINKATIQKLTNEDELASLVRGSIEGKYSDNIGSLIGDEIEAVLKEVEIEHGYFYKRDIEIPLLKRNVNFVLENEYSPTIILDYSYSVTTSSSQTNKRKTAEMSRKKLDEYNSNRNKKVTYINFIDGAGWIGRQSDMKKIHKASDYILNLKTIRMLKQIILHYSNDFNK